MLGFMSGKRFRKKFLFVFPRGRDWFGGMMKPSQKKPVTAKSRDKQLAGVSLELVLEKRRLDQALNAKEFAVCAGVSYSTARDWFRLPGFPVFHGVIFWQDFVAWRAARNACPVATRPNDCRGGANRRQEA